MFSKCLLVDYYYSHYYHYQYRIIFLLLYPYTVLVKNLSGRISILISPRPFVRCVINLLRKLITILRGFGERLNNRCKAVRMGLDTQYMFNLCHCYHYPNYYCHYCQQHLNLIADTSVINMS